VSAIGVIVAALSAMSISDCLHVEHAAAMQDED
jgi:hypothetical protein